MIGRELLETYFSDFRRNIIGADVTFDFGAGRKQVVYADWTATGRAYAPIEHLLTDEILPYFANTHTETTVTGSLMSAAYNKARAIIKSHVGANDEDVLIFCGSGMTAAVNKLQRLLGLRSNVSRGAGFRSSSSVICAEENKPVIFVTSMEHHSNHISWLETESTVEVIGQSAQGNVDLDHLSELLRKYRGRKYKVAAITACSNVTGIRTPYHKIAGIMHENNGFCFVDFASSAPYVAIDIHPPEKGAHLDAIYFSMHKFLGGPGTPGVLIFNRQLYNNETPDQPGGGTVAYTSPWGDRDYVADVEGREDGGTPPVLQAIKAALCIRLKEAMGVKNMLAREQELTAAALRRLSRMTGIEVLAPDGKDRLGIISFIVTGVHYNLVVRLLNDRFGIQVRGGCSCAGTYGHRLLNVDRATSAAIRSRILTGDLSSKPGWVRLSLHPTMTNQELHFILDAIEETQMNALTWSTEYGYNSLTNEFTTSHSDYTGLADQWLSPKLHEPEFNLRRH